MGAEVGATTSTFPYTPNMRAYLHATGRAPVAHAADQAAANGFLASDEGAEYDEVIEIVILHLLGTIRTANSSQGSLKSGAYDQRPFHARFGHSLVQIRILHQEE
jgi:hypothetical protein